ncbi:MAG: hypothetical protein JKY95_18255 [Planctomycetaceae bacterium]|nr:hypothetical protein [Planctomycetaceae bacterium]
MSTAQASWIASELAAWDGYELIINNTSAMASEITDPEAMADENMVALAEGTETTGSRRTWNEFIDGVQDTLGWAGMFPGAGAVPDGANVIISLGRGRFSGATIHSLAVILFFGQGIQGFNKGRKLLNKAGDVNDAIKTTGNLSKGIIRSLSDRISDFRANPQNWERVSSGVVESTSRRAKGGVSIESVYRNKQTGETLHVHDVFDSAGKQIDKHPSFRNSGK